jgi:hypothetical protein
MNSHHLTPFEEQVMNAVLEGEDSALRILRDQLRISKVAKREMTGVGFYLHFEVPKIAPRLPGYPDLIVNNDIQAELEGLAHGAGFVLWVKKGAIDQLEGYSYEEQWPKEIAGFKLSRADHLGSVTLRGTKDT